MVSIGDGLGRFVPVVMMVQRGDATGMPGLFQISCLTVNFVTLYRVPVR
jgi:hypothetical protein